MSFASMKPRGPMPPMEAEPDSADVEGDLPETSPTEELPEDVSADVSAVAEQRNSRRPSAAAENPETAIDMSALQQSPAAVDFVTPYTADSAGGSGLPESLESSAVASPLDTPGSERPGETEIEPPANPRGSFRSSFRMPASHGRPSAVDSPDQEEIPDDTLFEESAANMEDQEDDEYEEDEENVVRMGAATSCPTNFFRSKGISGNKRQREIDNKTLLQIQKNLEYAAMNGTKINWRALFKAQDKNNTGSLHDEQLQNMIRKVAKIGPEVVDDAMLRFLFGKMDADGSGEITLEEFLTYFCPAQLEVEHENPKEGYKKPGASYFDKVRVQASLDTAKQRHEALRKRLRAAAYDRGDVNWNRLFRKFDKDGSGEMDIDEFLTCIRREGKVPIDIMTDQELINLFKFIDKSGDGKIKFEEEFIHWLDPEHERAPPREPIRRKRDPTAIVQQTAAMIEQIKTRLRAAAYRNGGVSWEALFAAYDRDNSGEVDYDEFRAAVRKDGKVTAEMCSEAQLEALFSVVDANKDGKVTLDSEFITWMNRDMDEKEMLSIGKRSRPAKALTSSSPDAPNVKTFGDFLKGRKQQEDATVTSRIEELKALAQTQAEEIERLRAEHARELQTLHNDYDGLTERLEKAGVVSGDDLRRTYFPGEELRKPTGSPMSARNLRGATSSAAPSESGLDTPTWDQSLTFTEASQQGGGGRGELFDLALPLMNTHSSKNAKARALANLRNALEAGAADPNMWKGKSTPLHAAVKSGNIDYVALLLEYGADPNTRDEQGVSVLHMATYDGQVDLCLLLLDGFADPNSVDQYNQSPLFFSPNRNMCELLFQRHADTNLVNVQGQTAMHLAGKAGFEDVLIWLGKHMPRSLIDCRDASGRRGLDYAIESDVNPVILKRMFTWEPQREMHISSKDVIKNRPAKPPDYDEGEESEEDEMLDRFILQSVKQKLKAAAFWQGGFDWKKLFESYDDDNSGELDFPQFLNCIREGANICESMLSDKGLKRLFDSVDADGGGTIDYQTEFLPWLDPDYVEREEDNEEDEFADEVKIINTRKGKVFVVGKKKFTADDLRTRLRTAAYDNGEVNWRKVFKNAMKDGGDLTFDKFRVAMRKNARLNTNQMPDAILAAIFNNIDVDGGGHINFEEELLPWLEPEGEKGPANNALSPQLLKKMNAAVKRQKDKQAKADQDRFDKYVQEAKERLKIASFEHGVQNWKKLFQRYDTDKSGYISFDEFYNCLRKSARLPHNALTDDDIRVLFDMLDVDKDGFLSYSKEFLPWAAEGDYEEALTRGSKKGLVLKGTAAAVINRYNEKVKALKAAQKAEAQRQLDTAVKQAKEKLKVAAYCKGKVDWKYLFTVYDVDNSGEVDFEEFRNVVRKQAKIGVAQLSEENVKLLFEAIDTNGGGTINYLTEFIPWLGDEQEEADENAANAQKFVKRMLKNRKQRRQEEFEAKVKQSKARERMRAAAYQSGREGRMDIKRMFQKYDVDGSGEVDFDEFKEVMRRAAKVPPSMLSDDDLQHLFDLLDKDGGGAVDYETEFAAWLNGEEDPTKKMEKTRSPGSQFVDVVRKSLAAAKAAKLKVEQQQGKTASK